MVPLKNAKREIPSLTGGRKHGIYVLDDGLVLGYDFHPGGLWSGRYRVLSWEKMRQNPELKPNQAIIQYVDTVFPSAHKKWYFPLGVLKRNHQEGMLEEKWKLSATELRQRLADLTAEWDAGGKPS